MLVGGVLGYGIGEARFAGIADGCVGGGDGVEVIVVGVEVIPREAAAERPFVVVSPRGRASARGFFAVDAEGFVELLVGSVVAEGSRHQLSTCGFVALRRGTHLHFEALAADAVELVAPEEHVLLADGSVGFGHRLLLARLCGACGL